MPDTESILTPSAEEKTPLSDWQRWLEFLQVIAVLIIATGIALPFAFGLQVVGAWFGAAALVVTGVVIARLALRLINPDAEIATSQKFEITATRLLTLKSTGVPADVLDALRGMCIGEVPRWSGEAPKFRDDFYARVGEKRGAVYLARILPYLAVYGAPTAPDPPGAPGQNPLEPMMVSHEDSSVPAASARLSLGGPSSH